MKIENKLIFPLIAAVIFLNCNKKLENFEALRETYASVEAIDAHSKNKSLDFKNIKIVDTYSDITRLIKEGRKQFHVNLDSSMILYNQALLRLKEMDSSEFGKRRRKKNIKNLYGMILHLLGDCHYAKGNKDDAFLFYNKSLLEFEKIGFKKGIEKIKNRF